MKSSGKKKRRDIEYDSCIDFEYLYKKKKNYKKKYSIYREKNYSDSEIYNKRRFQIKKQNRYIYIHKHYNKDDKKYENKLCLLDDVIVYKNYFDKYDEQNNEKIKNLKNILKIYENVSNNEKKKLYQIIKSFSYTQGGFQNNKIRQKIWLLLLGFNINLSKNKEYNEHPINILCKKYRNKFIYNNFSNHFKLIWNKSQHQACITSSVTSHVSETISEKKKNQICSKNYSQNSSQICSKNSSQISNKISSQNSNFETSKDSIVKTNSDIDRNEKSESLISLFDQNRGNGMPNKNAENDMPKRGINIICNSGEQVDNVINSDMWNPDFSSMCLRKRKKKCILGRRNITNSFISEKKDKNENLINIKKKRKKNNTEYSKKKTNEIFDQREKNSREIKCTYLFGNNKKYHKNFLYKYISPKTNTELGYSINLSNLDEYSSEEFQNKKFSDDSNNSIDTIENKSSTASTLLSPNDDDDDDCYKYNSDDMSNNLNEKNSEKKCPLRFFLSPKSFDYEFLMKRIRKKKGSNKYSKILKLYFEKKINKIKKKTKLSSSNFGNINKKTKKFIKKNSKQVVNLLLNFEERNKNNNYDKKINKNFIIKLLKIIYENVLEVDIYIVDHIVNKYKDSNIKNDINRNLASLYFQNSIKYNYNLNSNLNKWLIDSVLLEENERIQVKKDVKRSVNTWNIHKNVIYEIKKKYQYILKNVICSILYKHSNKIYYAQGVHDVCLVFLTVYCHKFFMKYQKYVFLEHFIYKHAINKICRDIFEKKYNHINLPFHKKYKNDYMTHTNKNNFDNTHIVKRVLTTQLIQICGKKKKKKKLINSNDKKNGTTNVNIDEQKKEKEDDQYDILQNNISNMFLIEEKYIEKICILNNIKIEKYIKYKKKKKKKEYIVYLLCERFLLFYMIDYLTLSLDVSIKNTFKGVGLLLRYLDEEVYNVFCILQNEQECENKKHNSQYRNNQNNGNSQKTLQNKNDEKNKDDNKTENKKSSLQLSGTEFFFCLSWVVTYYAHVITEFNKLARLFDILLSNDGVFIIYFTSSIILHKKKELLEILDKKKKYLLYNSMYTEIHYIFQNLNWKDINVEHIINKTYYYMTHKISFDKFLKEMKKKIAFPPFSPIYSSPFILYYYNYQSQQGEKKNKKIQRSLINFYNYSHGQKLNRGHGRDEVERGQVGKGEVERGEVKRGEVERGEVERGEVERGEVERGEVKRGDVKRGGVGKKGNVCLYYPYYILYKHIDIYKEIIKKHILVEIFFQYIYYEFIINYKEICKKYDIYLTDQFYAMQYINNKNHDYIKIIKKKKKMEKIIYNMTKSITYLCADKYRQKYSKKLKPIFFNYIKLDNFLLPYTNLLEAEKNNYETDLFDYFSQFNNSYFFYYINKYTKKYTGKNDKDNYIGIIPPIYKYIIEDSKIMKIWGHDKIEYFKDITYKKKNGNIKKTKKNLNHIYYILKTSIHNYPYSNFFFIFFLISVFSSFWYFRR
ncbi:hypothetical protein Py17XNL_001205052 [Plasmodium yoelii yoelii]|uniref:Rab-GAP TBC domain-containing protein n=1 Tax=Plasmodium yoelii yoelii TaxID=73239 RepID=A0AAF0B6D1_PLAYO|nr:hypothetical protein Py17XNL_001205052 [Plasmodium yoelii yoelii]